MTITAALPNAPSRRPSGDTAPPASASRALSDGVDGLWSRLSCTARPRRLSTALRMPPRLHWFSAVSHLEPHRVIPTRFIIRKIGVTFHAASMQPVAEVAAFVGTRSNASIDERVRSGVKRSRGLELFATLSGVGHGM